MSFRWYVARRLAWTALATFIILTITFALLRLAPNAQVTDIAFAAAQQGQDVEQATEAARDRLNIDDPIWEQYVTYMANMYTLNWGWSSPCSPSPS